MHAPELCCRHIAAKPVELSSARVHGTPQRSTPQREGRWTRGHAKRTLERPAEHDEGEEKDGLLEKRPRVGAEGVCTGERHG